MADRTRDEEASLAPESGVEPAPIARSVPLPSGYSLSVKSGGVKSGGVESGGVESGGVESGGVEGPEGGARGQLELRAPDGRVCLTVVLGPDGPEVRIEAARLSIASRGKMELEAEELSIVTQKDLSFRSGGDVNLEATGHLSTKGFSQAIVATHGDIHVEANDDVRVDGERVRLNAPDAAPLRKREEGGDDECAS